MSKRRAAILIACVLASVSAGPALARRPAPTAPERRPSPRPLPPPCEPREHAEWTHLSIRDGAGREHPLDFSLKSDCAAARKAWIAETPAPVCGCRREGPWAATFICLTNVDGGEVREDRIRGFSRYNSVKLNLQHCQAMLEETAKRAPALPSPEPDEGSLPVIGPFTAPTPTPPGTILAPPGSALVPPGPVRSVFPQ